MKTLLRTIVVVMLFCNVNFAQQKHKENSELIPNELSVFKNVDKSSQEKLFGVPVATDYKRLFSISNTVSQIKGSNMPISIPKDDCFIKLYETDTTIHHSLVIVKPD